VSDSSRRGVPIEARTSAIRSATATASSQCGHAPPGPKRTQLATLTWELEVL